MYWGLTAPQQPGSYQGGEMMMKSVIWWRKPEYPEETTDLRQDRQTEHIWYLNLPTLTNMLFDLLVQGTCWWFRTGNHSPSIRHRLALQDRSNEVRRGQTGSEVGVKDWRLGSLSCNWSVAFTWPRKNLHIARQYEFPTWVNPGPRKDREGNNININIINKHHNGHGIKQTISLLNW